MTSERRYHPYLDGYPGREEAEEQLEGRVSSECPGSVPGCTPGKPRLSALGLRPLDPVLGLLRLRESDK